MSDCRKIIHIDCDCFFAAVEMREDPSLRGLPVAVGGAAERRGVVATCNYEARAFGVHSAMPTAQARRLCPQLLVIPPNFSLYREVALQIRDIFYDYTERVEPLSLDEAFLDVSHSERCRGSATLMAAEIRQRVASELGITVSAGVAPNKFLAKIASDWRKPDGLFVVEPATVEGFVAQLPVARLHGVGSVTAARLKRLGVNTCADLRRIDAVELSRQFGRFGVRLYELARGIDEREVSVERQRKSLSVEHTYASDLSGVEQCLQQLPRLSSELRERLERSGAAPAVRKQFVKIKFNNFQTTTIECGSTRPRVAIYERLCREAFARFSLPVRLLGLGVRFNEQDSAPAQQLPLFA